MMEWKVGGVAMPKGTTSSFTLVTSANATVGNPITVTGTGYDPTGNVWIKVHTPSAGGWFATRPDSVGHISCEWTSDTAGVTSFQSYRYDTRKGMLPLAYVETDVT